MKKKHILGMIAILTAAASVACMPWMMQSSSELAPTGYGSLFTSTTHNFNCGKNDDGCVGKPAPTGKRGEACASAILGLVHTGDMSLKAAASAGGVTTIRSIDVDNTSVLGSLWIQKCLIVTGD